MSLIKVGSAPQLLGHIDIVCPEMMFTLYLPVVMPGTDVRLPPNLEFCREVLSKIDYDSDEYVYLTVKSRYVTPESRGREGWHLDGFGTDDINYVWSDAHPTEFCIQECEVSNDCRLSMQELEAQVREENIITYPNKTLVRMDNTVIHRVSVAESCGYRTFVKISVSKDKYDLKGNAHNYLFDYNWHMKERNVDRNHPSTKM